MEKNIVDHKELAISALIIFVIWIVILTCFILMASGHANISIKCFAVDTVGNLYVGVDKRILVYSDGMLIRSFSSKTSRDYIFTINEGDTILLTTSSRHYTMDLYGKVLNDGAEYIETKYPKLQDNRTRLELPNGDQYVMRDTLGWTRIVKNNTTTVYKISGLSFLVKILLYLSVICFLVFLGRLFKRIPRNPA